MALKVAGYSARANQGVVSLESDAADLRVQIDELQSTDARRLAIEEAARRGLGAAATNGMPTFPYAVGEDDKPLEDWSKPPVKYRVDVPVAGRPG